jgi:hypothetical protein
MNFQSLNMNLNRNEFKKDSYSILMPLGRNQPRGPACTVQVACSARANSGLAAWPKAARGPAQIAVCGQPTLGPWAARPAHEAWPNGDKVSSERFLNLQSTHAARWWPPSRTEQRKRQRRATHRLCCGVLTVTVGGKVECYSGVDLHGRGAV